MPESEVQQPSYLEQAKGMAGQAYQSAAGTGQSALAAVGYGGKREETQPQAQTQQKRHEDTRVDAAPDRNVEDFLRDKYRSQITQASKRKWEGGLEA